MIALNLLYTESFLLKHNKVYAIIGPDDFDMWFVQSRYCTPCTYNQRTSRLRHKARTPSVLLRRSLFILLAIVLSVLLWFTDSDYLFGIFWPLCCLFIFDLQILITSLVSFGHCVGCSSLTYRFWLPLWYLLAIALAVLLRFTDSDYPFGIFWPLCCLFFFDLQILIIPLVSSYSSSYIFCIFLCCANRWFLYYVLTCYTGARWTNTLDGSGYKQNSIVFSKCKNWKTMK